MKKLQVGETNFFPKRICRGTPLLLHKRWNEDNKNHSKSISISSLSMFIANKQLKEKNTENDG